MLRLSYLKQQLQLEYLRDQLSLTQASKDSNLAEQFSTAYRVLTPWNASNSQSDLDLIARYYLIHGREALKAAGVNLDG
jgi:hypothetical protein